MGEAGVTETGETAMNCPGAWYTLPSVSVCVGGGSSSSFFPIQTERETAPLLAS